MNEHEPCSLMEAVQKANANTQRAIANFDRLRNSFDGLLKSHKRLCGSHKRINRLCDELLADNEKLVLLLGVLLMVKGARS